MEGRRAGIDRDRVGGMHVAREVCLEPERFRAEPDPSGAEGVDYLADLFLGDEGAAEDEELAANRCAAFPWGLRRGVPPTWLCRSVDAVDPIERMVP